MKKEGRLQELVGKLHKFRRDFLKVSKDEYVVSLIVGVDFM